MPAEDLILFRLGDTWGFTSKAVSNWSLFKNISESEVLKIRDKKRFSNLERIYSAYSYDEREQYREDFESRLAKIDTEQKINWPYKYKVGTIILVPKDSINRAIAARDGGAAQLQKDDSYRNINEAGAFISDEIESIITDRRYTRVILGTHGSDGAYVKKEMPHIRVVVWCRGLRDKLEDESIGSRVQKPGDPQDIDTAGLYGRWIDVSKYVQSLQTNVDDNGGNFNISLPPVQGRYNGDTQSWEADTATLSEYEANVVGTSSLYEKNSAGQLQRTEFFFKNAISSNDIVFVSFEPLGSEWDDRLVALSRGDNIIREGQVSPMFSPGQWDMIGLVDSVSQTMSAPSNEVSISISGRDLSKVIIDDGSYLFPLLFDEHNFLNKESRLVKRNLFTGSFNFYAKSRYRTIKEAVQWIINVVSNIRIIPDNVASAGGGTGEGLKEIRKVTSDGTEDIRNLRAEEGDILIGKLRKSYNPLLILSDKLDERIARSVVWTALYKKISALLDGIPEDQQVQIKYSDYYSVIKTGTGVPEPGTTVEIEENYRGAKLGGVVNPNDTLSDTLELLKAVYDVYHLDKKPAQPREVVESVGGGIWRWVRLIFDETIANRKLADVSLGRPDGSLINLIWNYAQAPWVEFFMDTWGSNFYFMFRTPPWTKKLIQEHLRKGWIDNVVVEDVDVLGENLEFDNEMYSIYQIDYKAAAWGTSTLLASVIPTIPFPELAEIWGNRRLRVSTNMLPLNDQEDKGGALNRSYLRDRGIDDLIFVVDTTIYKPFTRKGTITVNGDRRLKKGTWFLYKPTNEIFYITSVSQFYNSSLDRQTVIGVERGMVLDYVTGDKTIDVNGKQVELTYFNIVDSEKIGKSLKEQLNYVPKEEPKPEPDIDKIINDAYEHLEFETNKAIILPQPFPSLNALADLLKEHPEWTTLLAGHTDSDGSESFNMGLSKRRAKAVALYLSTRGVGRKSIEVSYFGETQPIDTNTTEEGKARNRRVDIQIVEKAGGKAAGTTVKDFKEPESTPRENGENIFKVNRPVLNFFLQKRQFGRDKVVIKDE